MSRTTKQYGRGARMLAASLGLLAVLAVGAPSSGAATRSSSAAAALEAKAIKDAEGGSWVHETDKAVEGGHGFSMDNDIGSFEGRQVIRSGAARADVIQIGQEAYIRGNAAAISNFFELTSNDPQQLADTWISISPADGGEFSTVAASVTLKSDFTSFAMSNPLTEGHPTEVDGQRCIPITSHTKEKDGTITSTLFVTDSSTPLPVELKASTPNGTSSTTNWSRWGKAVTLTAPDGAVPFSSLFGSG